MSVLTRVVISVPIAVGSWMLGMNAMTAAASQNIGPAQALELLSRSRTVDAKCKFLSVPEHVELGDYVAKAEIVTAGREGVGRAKSAVNSGIAQGKTMTCDRESEIVVRATMDAARRAMDEVRAQGAKPVQATAQQPKAKSEDSRKKLAVRNEALSNGALKRYSDEAAAYYVERRCRHLSQSQVIQFWRKIAAKHNALLGRFGPDAVRAAKNEAISRSRASGRCGARTVKIVKSGYSSIVR